MFLTNLGRLYTREAAQKACPDGWRLPGDEEWWTMASTYGKAYSSFAFAKPFGKVAYAPSKENKDEGAGKAAYEVLMSNDSTHFSAKLGGYRHTKGSYHHFNELGCYWTSTENAVKNAMGYNFVSASIKTLSRALSHKSFARSCRCIQEE